MKDTMKQILILIQYTDIYICMCMFSVHALDLLCPYSCKCGTIARTYGVVVHCI